MRGRRRVWRGVDEQFADANVVDLAGCGGRGVMVWAGVCYGQQTQAHLTGGILNEQRHSDETLRPFAVPFIHHLTYQGVLD